MASHARREADGEPRKGWRKCKVAVVGAGSSGLAAARELTLAGHEVTVIERGSRLGGLWASTLDAEGEEGRRDGTTTSDGGEGKKRRGNGKKRRIHSSVYPSLRTNLPRLLMGFSSFPFTEEAMELALEKERGRGRRGRELEVEKSEVESVEVKKDFRTYPGHASVLEYLRCYAAEHDLERHVRYGRELVRASPLFGEEEERSGGSALPWPRWRVRTRATVPATKEGGDDGAATEAFYSFHDDERASESGDDPSVEEETFDAVVCCSGHFAVPRFPPSAASAIARKERGDGGSFPGLILHAHSYRGPENGPLAEVFRRREGDGKKGNVVVAVVGAGPSGEDIARECSPFADTVLLCSAAWENVPFPRGERNNVEPRPFVVGLDGEGRVHFGGRDDGGRRGEDGPPSSSFPPPETASGSSPSPFPPPEKVDAVVYATGYLYDFPELSGTISVVDNEVMERGRGGDDLPLYEHLFPPSYAPGLSLLGLPFKVVPFPLVEAQARLVARALALVPGDGRERATGGEERNALPWPQREIAAAALEASRRRRSEAEGPVARRHTHRMGCPSHFDYIDRLVDAAESLGGGWGGEDGDGGRDDGDDGASPSSPSLRSWRLAPWRMRMYMRASEARRLDADSYRDTADLGEEEVAAAEAEAAAWVEERRRKTGAVEVRRR